MRCIHATVKDLPYRIAKVYNEPKEQRRNSRLHIGMQNMEFSSNDAPTSSTKGRNPLEAYGNRTKRTQGTHHIEWPTSSRG